MGARFLKVSVRGRESARASPPIAQEALHEMKISSIREVLMKVHVLPVLILAMFWFFVGGDESTQHKNADAASTPADFSFSTKVSLPEDSEYGKSLNDLVEGKSADLDGDGFAEARLTIDEKGSFYFTSTTPEGNVEFYAEKHRDGSEHLLQDTNKDGKTDVQEDLSFDGDAGQRSRRVRLADGDFDGYPEERRTEIIDYDNELMTVIEERDDEGNGNYIVLKQWERKISLPEFLRERLKAAQKRAGGTSIKAQQSGRQP